MNECLQCLDCQVDFYDDDKCPPLIARKKRKAARAGIGLDDLPELAGQLARVEAS